ncbi:hypothetical protein AOLI_G00154130 [Acnodon oligacanthus]
MLSTALAQLVQLCSISVSPVCVAFCHNYRPSPPVKPQESRTNQFRVRTHSDIVSDTLQFKREEYKEHREKKQNLLCIFANAMTSLENASEEDIPHKYKSRVNELFEDATDEESTWDPHKHGGDPALKRISDPPTPVCVTMRGESVDHPYSLKERDAQADPSLIHRQRAESYLSMRSELSVDEEESFEEENTFTNLRRTSDSSTPISVSMRSEQSMDYPFNFRESDSRFELRQINRERPRSRLSTMSEQFIEDSDCYREDTSADLSLSQKKRLTFSRGSMMSGHSMDYSHRDPKSDPSIQLKRSAVSIDKSTDSIFKIVELRVISLVKKELKRFRNLLSPDCSEGQTKEDEDQSDAREGALKITLHILRKMEQKNLAAVLQAKMAPFYQRKLKSKLKKTFQSVKEGTAKQHNSTLSEIYTELYITEGGYGEDDNEHEMKQLEEISRKRVTQETAIRLSAIFSPLPGQEKPRTVLTKGVAGIGKTVSVQKFILDWSEGKANQDVHFIFPLPFRELNLLKGKTLSLKDLLHRFFSEIAELALIGCDSFKVLFIFDGLDESRLPLDFQNNESLSDVTQSASVDVLLTNLIKGNLLPSALLWITSRPAACGQIPPECVDQVTEVRGFGDLQKEEYFRKRVSDQSLADRIIAHIKSSRSLHIMCHIPVFCWIAATVLERILSQAKKGEIPKTLTQMFTHFLIFETTQWSQKYHGTLKSDSDQIKENILALGKLAFRQLEKGNLMFYEEDLSECGIDVRDVTVYSGVCTQIFREKLGLQLGKIYSFVHLSVQEFLAALYVFMLFITSSRKEFEKQFPGFVASIHKPTMSDFLKSAVDKSLQSENGHLDLFLRFLLGLSMESNQTLLQNLLIQTGSSSHKDETVKYIKKMIKETRSPEKSVNLFHCLNELNDHSLVQEVQMYLNKSGKNHLTTASLSPAQWSALVFVLLNSEDELEEFNLSYYDPSEECFLKLLPVVKASRKAILNGCNLTEKSCAGLASALGSNSSNLKEVDLSTNNLQDSGVKLLSSGLENPHCKLEVLRLGGCRLTEKSCLTLTFTLSSDTSSLKELNLDNNNLQDLGVERLCEGLQNPQCNLEKLGLCNCNITHEGCAVLAPALKSNPSHLRELNLGMNQIGDTGIKLLSVLLEDPHCKLEKLELFDCSITEEGCAALASALKSNPSHLRELDLEHNNPGESGVKLLSPLLEDPRYKLEKLDLYTSSCMSLKERVMQPTRDLTQ